MTVSYIPKVKTADLEKTKWPSKLSGKEEQLQTLKVALYGKPIDESWNQNPVWSAIPVAGTAPVPAENTTQTIAFVTDRAGYELRQSVVESTGTATYGLPAIAAGGLSCPLDADVTDGATAWEITNGVTSRSRSARTVGTDPAFFFEATISIVDITDLGQLFLGFRKAEAYQADPDSYDELAAWHIGETGATVADGQFNIATILNNAATTYTDTTKTDWADNGSYTLRVEVSQSGACKFLVDGAEPAVTKAFSFDSGEVVVPFLFAEATGSSTTGDPGIVVSAWRTGWM